MDYTLKELLDIPTLRQLLDTMSEIHAMPSAIMDITGDVLTATAWQDICTKFHRINPETKQKCIESETCINAELDKETPYVIYRCPMGLVDAAIPIIIEGQHLGNVFVGQLFTETPDEARFAEQARRYGFDACEYLAAMGKVPVFSEEQLHKNLAFMGRLTHMLAEQGLNNKRTLEAAEMLKRSEERHRTILQTTRDGVWTVDMQGRFVEVNDSYSRMSGYSVPELLALNISDIDAKGKPEDTASRIEQIRQHDTALFESRHRRKDGSLFDVEVSTQYVPHGGGQIVAFVRDISERKQAELELRHSSDLMRYIIHYNQSALAVHDKDMRYLYVSQRYLDDYKVKDRDIIGKHHYEVFPDLPQKWRDVHKKALEGIMSSAEEDSYERADGTVDWTRWECRPWYESDGTIGGIIIYTDVITERKQAEAAKTRFMLRHRAILDNLPMMAWLKDTESRLEMVNEPYAKACARSVEECIGKTDMELFPPEMAKKYLEDDRLVCTTGQKVQVEEQIATPEGEKWHVTYKAPIIGEQGQIIGSAGIALDITERKKHEESLHSILEWTPISTIVHRDGIILYANPIAVRIFGASGVHELAGRPILDLIHKDFHQLSIDRKNSTDQGVILPPVEYKLFKLDGTEFDGEIQSTKFNYDSDTAYISCILDITSRKKAEEEKELFEQQLQHTQKLESLGVLSGGIAHDFNNILAIIMGYCSLTKMDYETAGQNIPEIEKAAERAAALCRQMLAYAGQTQLSKTQVNMWAMVDEMVTMLKSTLPQNAVIKPDLATGIPAIEGDGSQLRQVVMNLIINASEAIGTEQGEITVSLSRKTLCADHPEKDYHGKEIPPGAYVCLEVGDNGCGMDEETKWRIFEPFYTTKFTGRGLGMSAVLGIINSHNGALQLFSQRGEGTIFRIYLPMPQGGPAGEGDPATATPSVPWQGTGTILLVEDEEQIRFVAKSMLEIFGFTVLEAVNGKEALELYRENATGIRLVLTDMGMPVMDGYALFPALKQLNPELPIIISSGFGDEDVITRIGRDNIAGMINKPYNPNQLRDVVKNVLDGTAAAPRPVPSG